MQTADLAAAIHLAAHELQVGDPSLGLAVGSGLDGGPHGILVVFDPRGEGRQSPAEEKLRWPAADPDHPGKTNRPKPAHMHRLILDLGSGDL